MLIAAVALSLAATPGIAELGRSLAGRMRRRTARGVTDPEIVPRDMPGPVFIAGMGRRGRAVADALAEFGIGYASVERDQRRLRDAVADGYAVAFGDIGDPRLWSAVAMEGRRISVVTAPSLEVSMQLTPMARTFFPGLKRLAAVADAEAGAGFAALGVLPVVDGGPVPGLALAAAVLAELDVDPARIAAWATRQRERATQQPAEALAVAV